MTDKVVAVYDERVKAGTVVLLDSWCIG